MRSPEDKAALARTVLSFAVSGMLSEDSAPRETAARAASDQP